MLTISKRSFRIRFDDIIIVSRLIIGAHARLRERERGEPLSFRVFVAIKEDGIHERFVWTSLELKNVARASERVEDRRSRSRWWFLIGRKWRHGRVSRPTALILAASSWRALCGLTCVYFHRILVSTWDHPRWRCWWVDGWERRYGGMDGRESLLIATNCV